MELAEEVRVTETGEELTVRTDAQKVWDQTVKRRNIVEQLLECLV